MSGTFPPIGPTSLQKILPAYVYQQYSDDDNIQAFNSAFNGVAQNYLDWFNSINLPIYTGSQIAGPLLDWVAEGIYGLRRPALPYGQTSSIGLIGSWMPNTIEINSFTVTGIVSEFTTNDDIFKRIITWFFFKGDGQQFSIEWLKRRVMRFLIGTNGTAPNIDNTYPVSVTFGAGLFVSITTSNVIDSSIAQVLQAAIASGAVCLPFQFSFNVGIVNAVSNLYNDAGVLGVLSAASYPAAGALPAGSIYSNGRVVGVIPGVTPNPTAPPVIFGIVTAAQLLTLGGGDLPFSGVTPGSHQLWNPGGLGEVWIA